ncbi:MAG: DUF4019 domain-containing protein [Gemmatimonadota bacterium]
MIRACRMLAALALLPVLPATLDAQEPAQPTAVRLTEADSAFAAAIPAGESWLVLLDAGDYDGTWQAAAPQFQERVPQASWSEQAAQARSPLEPFADRTLISVQFATLVPDVEPGRYVVFQYVTAVAGDRSAVETLSMARQDDGSWRVAGYFVRPL